MRINKVALEREMAMRALTAKELAELSGISRQNFSTIRTRGSCAPATAGKLAKALGIDVREIMKEEA